MQFKVLHVHHSSLDAELVKKHINLSDFVVQTITTDSLNSQSLAACQASIIILQIMGDAKACAALCEQLHEAFPEGMFVLVLKEFDSEIIKKFILATNGSYFLEEQLELLPVLLEQYSMKQEALAKRELLIQTQHQTLLTLATSPSIVRGKWENALREITRMSARTNAINRVSVWLYNEDQNAITCKMLYKLDTDYYESGQVLSADDYPAYFGALKLNRVIVAEDAHTHPATSEFSETYLAPENIVSMLDTPIRLRGKMIGVVCQEQTGKKREWSLDDQQFATAIADLVVHTIENQEHQRIQAALLQSDSETREFLEKLKRLHEISLQLASAADFDELCLKAVQLGRKHLGFTRLGIWFLSQKTANMLVGAYGVDESGNIRDERHITRPLVDDRAYRDLRDPKISLRTWEKTSLFNHVGDVAGEGWLGSAALWDGNQIIGWISADNLGHERPTSVHDGEILKLFGLTLGHLCSQKRTESVMQESERYLKQAESIAHLGNFIFDVQTQNLSWSDELYRIFGQDVGSKMTLEHFQNLLPPKDFADFLVAVEKAVADKEGFEMEYDIFFEDDTKKQLFAMGRPIVDSNGTVDKIFGIIQDISERKKAQQQQIELNLNKQKLDFLRDFVEHMTHDLKTPLATLKATSYLLQRVEDKDKRQIQLERLHQQVNQLQKMIDDILTVARLDHMPELTFEDTALNPLIKEIEQQLSSTAQQKSIKLDLQLSDALPNVKAAPDELRRALMNLVENAINYTPKGGRVTVRSYADTGHIVCEVTDTGIGISESDLPHIYDQFYRADNGRSFGNGTGIGLAIVHKVIQLHKGQIDVKSVVDEGTTFRVRL